MNKSHRIVREKTPDRRIQRTRLLLREALTSLTVEKDYDSITIQEILDRANIGRTTFYAHFKDKDELLVSGFDEFKQLVKEFESRQKHRTARDAQRYDPALFFFRHAAENHILYKSMIRSEIVQNYLYKLVTNIAGEHIRSLARGLKKTPVPPPVVIHFLVSSFLAILNWWVQHDMPCSPEEAIGMFYTLTLPGLNAGLGMKSG